MDSTNKQIIFNLGKINHTLYGNTEKELGGFIPFLLSSGDLIIPQIRSVDSTQHLTEQLFSQWHNLWEDELDEEISVLIGKDVLLTACITPSRAINSANNPKITKEFFLLAKLLLLFQVSDEIMEEMSMEYMTTKMKNFDMESKEVQMMRAIGQALVNGINEGESGATVEDIPILIPRLKSILPFLTDFVRDLKDIIPDFKKDLKPFKKECEKSGSALIMKAKQGETEDCGLDDYANAEQRTRIIIELLALLENAKAPLEIRKSPRFKSYIDSVAGARAALLAILGLKRDIRLERSEKSIILKLALKGMGLEAAFELYFNRLLVYLNDINEGGKFLRATYPGNENLERFIKCCEDIINGQLYYHVHSTGQTLN